MAGMSPNMRVVSMDRNQPRQFHRPVQTKATLTVIDGTGAGTLHEVQTRGIAGGAISFLLRDVLSVGQNCNLNMNGQKRACEVVRSRPMSSGKYEIAVEMR